MAALNVDYIAWIITVWGAINSNHTGCKQNLDRIGSDRIDKTRTGSDRIDKTWIGLRPIDKTRTGSEKSRIVINFPQNSHVIPQSKMAEKEV